ncbi:hypothetical protein [Acidovorax sp. RAC01]|uniref:hypothetical protein n=1 Tax=Acidovorax sp. RAC01 TaxID=1842533 RepID=UPI00085868F9|nr:hypothetical protein [Acidovorax sp. RAC01]AOG23599.1 putative lipoprotein [Acidovorax sp. RAC01]
MFHCSRHISNSLSRIRNSVRAAAALGCAALALTGCGGGSSDAPPPSTLPAPADFAAQNFWDFTWAATPGATRYELHMDPDGAGPRPEARVDDFNEALVTGFRYAPTGVQRFAGSLLGDVPPVDRLNAGYRLRACDANGCGAFTGTLNVDLARRISRELAGAHAPLQSSQRSLLDTSVRLSADGLTLAVGTNALNIFTRASLAQPWQAAALTSAGAGGGAPIALSADGSTVAQRASVPVPGNEYRPRRVVHLYQRSGATWDLQASPEEPSIPSGCVAPCRADIADPFALSADGNVLAAAVNVTVPQGLGSQSTGTGVVIYLRSGNAWAQQAYVDNGGKAVSSLALSGDGTTVAVNEGALNSIHGRDSLTTTTPFVRILVRQGDGSWSQQARFPAGVVQALDVSGSRFSAMALSHDGSTLALHALNVPGHQTPELDLQRADLSCGAVAADAWYVGLHARNGSTWQRQAAISRGLETRLALASNGDALFYDGALFTRSNGTWACP